MIVSHRHQFVFVKTRKTAGSSIELALSSVCGPDDVISKIHENEDLRQQLGYPGPQNWRKPWWRAGPREWSHWVKRGRPPAYWWDHAPAEYARDRLGDDVWDGYFTFAVDRNPWDKAVSRWAWQRHAAGEQRPLARWIMEADPDFLTCWHLYADRDGPIVDLVVPFDRLPAGMGEVVDRIGVDLPPLPRAKSGIRKRRDWRSLYSDEAVERVAEVCRREIDLFGWTFAG